MTKDIRGLVKALESATEEILKRPTTSEECEPIRQAVLLRIDAFPVLVDILNKTAVTAEAMIALGDPWGQVILDFIGEGLDSIPSLVPLSAEDESVTWQDDTN